MSNNKTREENTLIVFVKNFELGKVKTRLAKSVGDDKAMLIYRAMVKRLSHELGQLSQCRICIYYSKYIEEEKLWPEGCKYFVQAEGDLGFKMRSAIKEQLSQNRNVVLIGTDIPKLTAVIIEQAFESLKTSEVTIGGTFDGGYYLIGANEDYSFLFEDMIWSTPTVFKETLDRCLINKKNIHQLPTLSDVDYIEDWDAHGWELTD